MNFIIVLFSSILGLVTGSFLNVAILRGLAKEKLSGRSHCPFCKQKLSIKELIPVVSFLAQKGRCLRCGQKISWQYPLVEILTTIVFAVSVWFFTRDSAGFNFYSLSQLVLLLIGLSAALIITVADLRFKIIPNGPLLILILLGFYLFAQKWYYFGIRPAGIGLTASLIIALFLGAIWFFSKGQMMGFGDPKLIFTVSLILGFPASLSAFICTFWLGGIVSLGLLALRTYGLKSQIPLGPFIIAGSILAYFFSQPFLNFMGFSQIFL